MDFVISIDHELYLLLAGSPLIGFGEVPLDPPVSVIDFHGLADGVIPYDAASGNGEGPFDSVVSWDYYYYEQKPATVAKWAAEMGCGGEAAYPTDMDGVGGWACQIWSDCLGGAEVAHCTGQYGHNYPFAGQNPPYIGGTRILWEFMRSHRKN